MKRKFVPVSFKETDDVCQCVCVCGGDSPPKVFTFTFTLRVNEGGGLYFWKFFNRFS